MLCQRVIDVHHPDHREERNKKIDAGDQRQQRDDEAAAEDGLAILLAQGFGLRFAEMIACGAFEKFAPDQIAVERYRHDKPDADQIKWQDQEIQRD